MIRQDHHHDDPAEEDMGYQTRRLHDKNCESKSEPKPKCERGSNINRKETPW